MQFPDSVSKLISLSLCICLQHPLQIQHSSFHNYHQNSYIITHTCTIFILLFSVIVLHVVAKLQLGFCLSVSLPVSLLVDNFRTSACYYLGDQTVLVKFPTARLTIIVNVFILGHPIILIWLLSFIIFHVVAYLQLTCVHIVMAVEICRTS